MFPLTSTQAVVTNHQTLKQKRPINCVETIGELAVCGGSAGSITGYRWSSLATTAQPSTADATPEFSLHLGDWDVNDLIDIEDGRYLLLGCGDGVVRMANVELPNKVLPASGGWALINNFSRLLPSSTGMRSK